MAKTSNIILNPILWLAIALTLGLAPFFPEPHVWEKLKWIFAGAKGMQALDWFDFFLHGTPWLLFVVSLVKKLFKT